MKSLRTTILLTIIVGLLVFVAYLLLQKENTLLSNRNIAPQNTILTESIIQQDLNQVLIQTESCGENCINVYAYNPRTQKRSTVVEGVFSASVLGSTVNVGWMSGVDGEYTYNPETDSFDYSSEFGSYGI